jgi:HTH-type transcriptional regulator, competence development regulator
MDQPMDPKAFGAYLKAVREAAGLTLRQVEEQTDRVVKNAYLSQIESGAINRPSPGILYELAQVYGVSYRELLVRAGHRVPEADVKPDRQALAGLPLRAFAQLDDEDRQALIEYAAFLRQRKKGR